MQLYELVGTLMHEQEDRLLVKLMQWKRRSSVFFGIQ